MNKNGKSTTDTVRDIVLPVCEKMGLSLWDITFEKEGADYFLKVLVEKKEGSINIDECEAFSRAIDPLIDEADPIDQSYFLEVGSPGLCRRLRLEEHFARYIGDMVRVRLIRPDENKEKEYLGNLLSADRAQITIQTENGEKTFKLSDTAFVKLCDD